MRRKLNFEHIPDINSTDTSDIKSVVSDFVTEKKSTQPSIIETVKEADMHGLIQESMQESIQGSIQGLTHASEQDLIQPMRKRSKKLETKEETSFKDLAKSHTEAEQKVYKAMLSETNRQGLSELYFSFQDISKKTRFKNRRTIIVAIKGLIDKRSIDIVEDNSGSHLGRSYHVYMPQEIIDRREKEGIKIHPQTKKIIQR